MKKKALVVLSILSAVIIIGIVLIFYTGHQTYYDDIKTKDIVDDELYGKYVSEQLVIIFDKDTRYGEVKKFIEPYDGKIVGAISDLKMYQVVFEKSDIDKLFDIKDKLLNESMVIAASLNTVMDTTDMTGKLWTPMFPSAYDEQDNRAMLETMALDVAWRLLWGSEIELNDVRIGVLDTAIDKDFSAFDGDINFDLDTRKSSGIGLYHGTKVTNLIAGKYLDFEGVTGVASILGDNLSIVHKDIAAGFEPEDVTNTMLFALTAAAYNMIMVDDVTIFNCSIGGLDKSDDHSVVSLLNIYFNQLYQAFPEVLFVVAAGNDGDFVEEIYCYPACINTDNIITVASLDSDNDISSFSNLTRNESIDIAAYGNGILVGTLGENYYLYGNGTSYSAPFVTGTAALLKSIDPSLSAKDIKEIILETATTQGITALAGGRLLNIAEAVFYTINNTSRDTYDPAVIAEKTDIEAYAYVVDEGYAIEASALGDEEAVLLIMLSDMQSDIVDIIEGDVVQIIQPGEIAKWVVQNKSDEVEDILLGRISKDKNSELAYAYILLDEASTGIIASNGYPEMIGFTKKIRMDKNSLKSLKGSMAADEIIESLFFWYDTVGDSSAYPDLDEQYGWLYNDDGKKSYYKGPDIKWGIYYFDNGSLSLISGRYGEGRKVEIYFYEDGTPESIDNDLYQYDNGVLKVDFRSNGTMSMYEEIEEDVYITESYNESEVMVSEVRKIFLEDQWVLHGIQNSYYDDGKLKSSEEMYHGVNEGNYNTYNSLGQPLIDAYYTNGQLDGEYLRYEDIEDYGYFLFEESVYADGVKNGITTYYDLGDIKRAVYRYSNGLLDGIYQTYVDGALKFDGTCSNDEATGVWYEYDENGNVHGYGTVYLEEVSGSSFMNSSLVIPRRHILKNQDWVYE